jgi:hypothetical protein
MAESKNILTEDLGNGTFRQTETVGMPAVQSRQVCTDATRPDASTFLPGTGVFNLDDQAWNYSGTDGAWHDALGGLT